MSGSDPVGYISPARQDDHPCREKVQRPGPAGAETQSFHRQIEQGRAAEAAGLSPIKARVRHENDETTEEQRPNACRGGPVGDTNEEGMRSAAGPVRRQLPPGALGRGVSSSVGGERHRGYKCKPRACESARIFPDNPTPG